MGWIWNNYLNVAWWIEYEDKMRSMAHELYACEHMWCNEIMGWWHNESTKVGDVMTHRSAWVPLLVCTYLHIIWWFCYIKNLECLLTMRPRDTKLDLPPSTLDMGSMRQNKTLDGPRHGEYMRFDYDIKRVTRLVWHDGIRVAWGTKEEVNTMIMAHNVRS